MCKNFYGFFVSEISAKLVKNVLQLLDKRGGGVLQLWRKEKI